jgi:hypothetical protein
MAFNIPISGGGGDGGGGGDTVLVSFRAGKLVASEGANGKFSVKPLEHKGEVRRHTTPTPTRHSCHARPHYSSSCPLVLVVSCRSKQRR